MQKMMIALGIALATVTPAKAADYEFEARMANLSAVYEGMAHLSGSCVTEVKVYGSGKEDCAKFVRLASSKYGEALEEMADIWAKLQVLPEDQWSENLVYHGKSAVEYKQKVERDLQLINTLLPD